MAYIGVKNMYTVIVKVTGYSKQYYNHDFGYRDYYPAQNQSPFKILIAAINLFIDNMRIIRFNDNYADALYFSRLIENPNMFVMFLNLIRCLNISQQIAYSDFKTVKESSRKFLGSLKTIPKGNGDYEVIADDTVVKCQHS